MPKKVTSASGTMLGVSPDGTGGAVVGVGTGRIWLRTRAEMEDLLAVMCGAPEAGGFARDRDGLRHGPVTLLVAPFQAERIRSRLEQLLAPVENGRQVE
jgi:hypothetical protein